MTKETAEDVVFLLTSTSSPYLRDALDLMFYPSGVDYRFRYDKKWLSPKLKSADGRISKEKVQNLVGKKAILVHILTERDGQRDRILEFLPIREAAIREVKILGGFLWLNFILGDWIVYHEEAIADKTNEHHELFKRQTPEDSRESVHQLVFSVNRFSVEMIPDDPTGENEDVLSNWTLIATHMSRFALHASKETLVFMKLVSLKSIDDEKTLCAKIIDSDQRGFEFKVGKSYSLDIAEYCGKNIEPFEMELKTEIDSIVPTLGRTEVRGKYDMLHFMVNCKSTEKERLSALLFEPLEAKNCLLSKALLKVKIKPRKWLSVRIPLISFTISTFVTSKEFLSLFSGEPVNYWVLIAAASGSVASAISLFFLRR